MTAMTRQLLPGPILTSRPRMQLSPKTPFPHRQHIPFAVWPGNLLGMIEGCGCGRRGLSPTQQHQVVLYRLITLEAFRLVLDCIIAYHC
jgi:hypothetical protein